jgi:hypothetical protein
MALLSRGTSRETAGERRAAACVTACEGIPTELLERGFILRLIAACVHVEDGRVRDALEELVRHRLRLMDGKPDTKGRSGRPGGSPRNAAPGVPSMDARGGFAGS